MDHGLLSGPPMPHTPISAGRQGTRSHTTDELSQLPSTRPVFRARVIESWQVGTASRDDEKFTPLDDISRQNPSSWRRRWVFEVVCEEAPGSILVEVGLKAGGTIFLPGGLLQFVAGRSHDVEYLLVPNIRVYEIRLFVRSHMASDPRHIWRQWLPIV